MRILLAIGSLLVYLLLSACAASPQTDRLLLKIPEQFTPPHELSQTPFIPQQDYQCGPAALASLIRQQGIDVDLQRLIERVYIPQRKGALQLELISATREFDLIPYVLAPELTELLREVLAGRPVLVLQNLGVSWYPQWHYAVVIGYDLPNEKIILRSGNIRRYPLNLRTFEYTWARSERWAMVLLKPGELPQSGDILPYMKALLGFNAAQNQSVLIPAYRAGVLRWPQASNLKLGYANALYQANQPEQAVQQLEQALEQNKRFAPAYNNAAQIYLQLGQSAKALEYARQAVAIGGVHIEEYRSTLNDIQQAITKMHE